MQIFADFHILVYFFSSANSTHTNNFNTKNVIATVDWGSIEFICAQVAISIKHGCFPKKKEKSHPIWTAFTENKVTYSTACRCVTSMIGQEKNLRKNHWVYVEAI